jgi:hypothetical protein
MRAVNDAIVLLAGRCHVGHRNANLLHAHGSACTLVAATQDVAAESPDGWKHEYGRKARRRTMRSRQCEDGMDERVTTIGYTKKEDAENTK